MGVLVDHQIAALTEGSSPSIRLDKKFIQSCSADLPIGRVIRQVAGEPARNDQFRMESFLKHHTLNTLSVSRRAVTIVPGHTYVVELSVEFSLPNGVFVYFNPKSSSGRNGLHAKVICDGGQEYDILSKGYTGKVYAVVTPRVFPVELVAGDSLVQARFIDGQREFLRGRELEHWDRQLPLVTNPGAKAQIIDDSLVLHLNLKTFPSNLVANRGGGPIPLRKRGALDPQDYFREKRLANGDLFLEEREFALACSEELVRVPRELCAEMVAYNPRHGDYRTHDAGFFDAGFGNGRDGEVAGATVIFEITNFNVAATMFSHGQRIASLIYERLEGVPQKVYGEGVSHYQGQQSIQTSKNFRPWESRIT